MVTRYDVAYYALSPLGIPYLAWRWMRRGKYRESSRGMLGRELPEASARERFANGSVWMHAVSVGEVAAARAVEPGLRRLFPDLPFVVSTITETGQAAARRDIPHAEAHTFFPADLSWNVQKFLDAYRPRYVMLLETELWPNFLTMARRCGARIFLLNGRLSDRSFPRYRMGRGLLAPVFDSISGVCVQTEQDRRRFAELGIDEARIAVTGNCKFDLDVPLLSPEQRSERRRELGLSVTSPVIVAGSTHEGEETLILDAFESARGAADGLSLILAPRHPERFADAARLARSRGYRVRLASETPSASHAEPSPEVVILDRMGVLAQTYGLGDVAIVAGSFGSTGGHNLLEAAAHAVPVVYGPNMKNQRELAAQFKAAGAGTQVDAAGLAPALARLLRDAELRRREGEKAYQVLRANQGSAQRCIEALEEWI